MVYIDKCRFEIQEQKKFRHGIPHILAHFEYCHPVKENYYVMSKSNSRTGLFKTERKKLKGFEIWIMECTIVNRPRALKISELRLGMLWTTTPGVLEREIGGSRH